MAKYTHILNRLNSGHMVDVHTMKEECKYGSTTSVNSVLSRMRGGGIDIVKVHPKKGHYALAGSPPAFEAVRKYHGRPESTRLIPYAWDARVNNNAPGFFSPQPPTPAAPPDSFTDQPQLIVAAAPMGEAGAWIQKLDSDPPAPVKVAPEKYAVINFPPPDPQPDPLRLVIICPNGCSPPDILQDAEAGLVLIETDGRPIDVRIATKYRGL